MQSTNILTSLSTTPKRIAVKLKPKGEKSVRQGHPWIFSDSIDSTNKEGKAGDLAIVFDRKKNKFLAMGLYDPDSPIAIKIIHCGASTQVDESFWRAKFTKALELRRPLPTIKTNAFRWIYGEGDGLPGLILDVYNQVGVIKIYSAIWLPYLALFVQLMQEIFPLEAVLLRHNRLLQRKMTSLDLPDGSVISGYLDQEEVLFSEHGLQFITNVIHGHKTGFFLDHRHNRHAIGKLSKGKKVLDVFSYTGGFSVHAMAGGADSVTSLDISAQAQEMAKRNIALNGDSARHLTMAGDAFEVMENMIREKKIYDLVIIDPPSFAKRASEIRRALHSYQALTLLGIQLVNPGGVLVMASCSSRVDAATFYGIIEKTMEEYCRYEIIEKTGHDMDHPIRFPEGAYLKTGYYRIEKSKVA